jgi:hypothetical protein
MIDRKEAYDTLKNLSKSYYERDRSYNGCCGFYEVQVLELLSGFSTPEEVFKRIQDMIGELKG